ncbi:MAG: flippase [Syntrophales bacterium]|jgi:O-antigen/teichoic acid export membrane protein|nr:flippase [Syntrophales bacterium]MDY0044456.1 flippase [Syntrophales bacterium]
MTKDLFKNLFKYLPAQIAPGVVAFASIPLLTRLFSPHEYGNYALVLAIIGVATMMVGWLSVSVVRFYPIYERDGKLQEFFTTVMKTSLISVLAVSAVFSLILAFSESKIPESLFRLMRVGIPVFALTTLFLVFIEFFRATQHIGIYSLFKIWKSVTTLLFGIGLAVLMDLGIEGLLWGAFLSAMIALPFFRIISPRKVRNPGRISMPLTADMARYGFPLVIGNLAAWVLSLSDRFILECYRGSAEVGIYSASYNISEQSMVMLSMLFGLVSGSTVYRIWETDGIQKSREFLNKITRYYLIICIPAAAGLIALSEPLVTLLTGEQYHEGSIILPFVTIGVLLFGLQQRFYPALNFFKKTYLIMLSILSAGLLNVALNFLFIPQYGYKAAAMTTCGSYIFLLFTTIFISRRFFVWEFPVATLMRSLIASAIMGVTIYGLNNSLTNSPAADIIVGMCSGPVLYFLVLFVLMEFSGDEISGMYQLIRGFFKHPSTNARNTQSVATIIEESSAPEEVLR